jgi:hypothetical protein
VPLIAIVAALAFALLWRHAERTGAALLATIAEQAREITAARAQAHTADTVFMRDTVRLTASVTRYRTLRDTLLMHTTDTLTVERFVTVADSTIQACSVALRDCAARADAWHAVADSEAVQIRALTKARKGCRVALLIPCPRPMLGVGLAVDGKAHLLVGLGIGF